MKNLLFSLLFSFTLSLTFSQDISGPKPILSVGGSNITPDTSFFTLGCGTNSLTITADYVEDLGSPDSYRIEQVPFNEKSYLPTSGNTVLTPAVLGVPGQMISGLSDDTWSAIQQLASNGSNLEFCYFGQPKTEFVVSSNGILSFDTSYANNPSSWRLDTMGKIEPTADCGDHNDSILQIHDTNPTDSDGNWNTYMFWAISGIENERFLTMGTHHMPMFYCGADYGFANHQMVLYETTNIIEFNIRDKPLCHFWANGWQAFGLQNFDSTVGLAVPGLDNQVQNQILNSADPFNVGRENPNHPLSDSVSYRFIPNGVNGVTPVFGWYINWDNVTNTGTLVSTNLDLSVLASDLPFDAAGNAVSVTYTAVATYVEYCSGITYHATNNVTLEAIPVRMHIIENGSTTPDEEIIDIEQIEICEGDNYLLLANVQINSPTVNYTVEWTVESFGNPATVIDDGDGDPLTYLISNATNPPDTYIYTCTLTATGSVNCVFSDSVEIRVFDDTATMEYPAPKTFCASDLDTAATPGNVFPTPSATAPQNEVETYYYTINNGGVWVNPLATDPTRSLDGIVDLSASIAAATTTNADGSADFTITYHAKCPNNTQNDTITIRNAPLVLDPAVGDPAANPVIEPSPLIVVCETNTTLHTADFDITGIETYIANGTPLADLTIVWESQTGGVILPNPMPSPYNTTTISVKVTITDPSDAAACEVEFFFDLTVSTKADAGTPVNNLKLCENDFSPGIATFNGTNIENTILMGQDPAIYTVHYSYIDNVGVTQTFDGPLPANYDSPTRTYTANVTDASGVCPSDNITFTLEVRTIPLVTPPTTDLILCETNTTNHTAEFDTSTWATVILASNTTPINTDFVIEYDYVDSTGASIVGANTIPNPLTSGSQTITIRARNVTAGEQTCSSGDETFDLVVNLKPVETPQTPIFICSDEALNVVLANYTTLTRNTYEWIATDNPNVTGETTTISTNGTITDVITNVTLVNQVVTYTITPTADASNANCVGDDFTIDVTIRPEPAGTDTVVPTCSAVTAGVDLNTITTLTGNTYSWVVTDNPDVTGETTGAQTGNMITETLTNTSTVNQDVIYTVTPTGTAPNSCVGQPFTITINVGVEPIGTDPNLTVCSYNTNNAVSLNIDLDDTTITTLTGNTFSWVAVDNPNIQGETVGISTNGIITDNLINQTTTAQTVIYTVTPTSANNCIGNVFSVTVTVNPEPVAPAINTENTCSDVALNLDLNSYITNLTGNDNTFSWTAVANGTVTNFSASGTSDTITDTITNTSGNAVDVTYTITPTSALGCVGENFNIVATIDDEPLGTNDTQTICSDDTLAIDLNTLVNKAGTTFTWITTSNGTVTGVTASGTSTNITDTINNISNVPVEVTYTITPTNGCLGNDFTVIITVNPEPVGTSPVPLDACSDVEFTINLENHTSMTDSNNTYEWQAIDNTNVTGETITLTTSNTIVETITNISATPQTVTYTITPISANGCRGNLFTIDVEVGQKPVELTIPPVPTPYCSNDVLSIDLSTFTTLISNTYQWIATDNTDTNTDGDFTVIGETTTLTAGNTITDAIKNTSTTIQQVTYTITPTSANGCKGDDFTITVDINPEPVGDSDIEETACSDVAIAFDLTTYTTLTNNTYVWLAADNPNVTGETIANSTATSITDTLTNTSTENQEVIYTVTPTSSLGCVGKAFEVKVDVGVEPVGNNSNIVSCSDDPDFEINLNTFITNLSSNDYTFSWYADNNNFVSGETTTPSTGNLITDTLTNTSGIPQNIVYHITPTSAAPNSCEGNTFTITVEVGFEPVGTTSIENICNDVPLSLSLDNYTTLTSNTYKWYAIDNPNVTGETITETNTNIINDTILNTTGSVQIVDYMITPISAAGCEGDEFLISVEVNPRPQFYLLPQYFICPDVQEVTIGEDNPDDYTYHWYEANDMNIIIGYDETLLVSENNLAQSNGTYVLTVTDTLGCVYSQFTSVSMAEQMIISEIHVSDFNRPDNTIIIDVVGGSGVFEYTLTFIDYTGTTQSITQNNPTFTGLVAATYQISVLDLTGCSVSIVSDDIHVLDYPPFFTPNGDLHHDTWQITGSHLIPTSKIHIFDRFGKVLAKIDPNNVVGWDGLYNGVQVPASDYWFTVEYLDPNNGEPKSVKGHFSIVRN